MGSQWKVQGISSTTNGAWLFWKRERDIVCFFTRLGVVDSSYLTRSTWTFSVMAFDIEKLFNRDDVAMREEVVRMEGKMCPSNAIKGADTSGQFDTLGIKRVEEGLRSFGPFWSRNNAKRHGSSYKRSHLWRKVINLDEDGCCRWTPPPTFVKQISIQTD